ncbi:MAG: NUDIX hydrolase [Desulfobacterales bacterium]
MKEPSRTHPNHYPDHPRVAVGAVVFHKGKVLLILRGKPPAEGQWAIPGGSVELGETLQVAAEREIREEAGITIRAGEPVYTFDLVQRDEAGDIRFHYVIIDLSAEYISGGLTAGDDAIDARWVSPEQLDDLQINPRTRHVLREYFSFGVK